MGIWPWSWYSATTASYSPTQHLAEDGVGLVRTAHPRGQARGREQALGEIDRGQDEVGFLVADASALAGERIEPGHRHARQANAEVRGQRLAP